MANTNKAGVQFTTYIPQETLNALKASAKREHRSINAQIVWFIEQGLKKERQKMLTWNNNTSRYEGTTADGHSIEVDGDVFSEDLAEMTRTYMAEKGLDKEEANDLAYDELIQVSGWTATPMDGVFIDGVYQGE